MAYQITQRLLGKNFYLNRRGQKPVGIVIHTMQGFMEGTYQHFLTHKVSVSYGISRNGDIHQYVLNKDAAWHADKTDRPTSDLVKEKKGIMPSLYTFGIEDEAKPLQPWTEEMYKASAWLIRELCTKYGIPFNRTHLFGHNEINLGDRANCPGRGVDLQKLIYRAANWYESPP